MGKLEHFVVGRTNHVLQLNNQYQLKEYFASAEQYYNKEKLACPGNTNKEEM